MAERPLIGLSPDQVSTNGMLGDLAFQDSNSAYIETIRGKVSLDKLDKEIADTAVDVFVYDTRKDSDGGAWRKRTQHTSWYNETLNTATRGSRKEFPAVAVIVAESSQLTIYDGDDPDLPMWMVFEANTTNWETTAKFLSTVTISSVFALNGKLVVGGSHGVPEVDFIDESQINRGRPDLGVTPKIHKNSGTIALRNNGIGQVTATTGDVTVNLVTNDVAMTVLPNAPIDSATGLPVPTIAVGTDGGVSIIKDDGTVADLTGFNPVQTVHIDESSVIGSVNSSGNDYLYKTTIPSGDTAYNTGITAGSYNYFLSSSGTSIPTLRDRDVSATAYDSKYDIVYRGGNNGFDAIKAGQAVSNNVSNSIIAAITSDYNTGWMQGRIKGAFLSDTDATNLSGYLYDDDMQDDDTSDWTDVFADTFEYISSPLVAYRLVRSIGDARVKKDLSSLISVGTKIIVTYEAYSSSGTKTIKYGMTNASYDQSVLSSVSVDTNWNPISFEATFGVTGSNAHTYVTLWNSDTGEVRYRNFKVRVIEEDRSVNNKSLAYFGTITKSAVATGAELVAYSGWSNSNYLVQPYNSDLNFGTGDFSTSFWIYTTDANLTGFVFDRGGPVNNTDPRFAVYNESDAIFLYTYASGASSTLAHSFDEYENQWTHVVMTRDSTGAMQIFINGTRVSSGSATARNVTSSTNPELTIGNRFSRDGTNPLDATISLLRISGSIPSPEQIKKIYEDEKVLFQENAACTLYGSSDAVTALAYDDSTSILYAGTSSGRSDFQGLRRINNTTTAVTTAMSASNGLVAEQ